MGGLVGYGAFDNTTFPGTTYASTITNSYFAGQIVNQPSQRVGTGGLAGGIDPHLTIPAVNSFWDASVIGGTVPTDNFASTTTLMKKVATYTAAKWDTKSWTLKQGSYPSLAWQTPVSLTLDLSGTGSVGITSNPSGLNCNKGVNSNIACSANFLSFVPDH